MIASIDTGDNSTKKPQFRQRVIKSLISTVTRYNAFLKELGGIIEWESIT